MSNEIVNIGGQDEEIVGSLGRSIVRTAVPLLVGFVLTLLLKVGVDLGDDPVAVANLTAFLTVLVSTAYYAVVRYAEVKLGSKWGWLLGLASAPVYTKVIDTTGVEAPGDPVPPAPGLDDPNPEG